MVKNALFAALAAALLVGCSSERDNEPTSVPRLIVDAARDVVTDRRGGKPEKVVVTPQMLADTKVAAIQVNPERRGGSDFLRPLTRRDDAGPGTVEVWASSDNAQIFLRNGVVVGTRGVGGDIISSDAALTVSALAQRASVTGQRRFVISDGDTTATEYRFECRITNMGSEPVVIVGQSFAATHLREACNDPATGLDVFANDYWVQSGTADVKLSRQWMGPQSGYFEIVLLKK